MFFLKDCKEVAGFEPGVEPNWFLLGEGLGLHLVETGFLEIPEQVSAHIAEEGQIDDVGGKQTLFMATQFLKFEFQLFGALAPEFRNVVFVEFEVEDLVTVSEHKFVPYKSGLNVFEVGDLLGIVVFIGGKDVLAGQGSQQLRRLPRKLYLLYQNLRSIILYHILLQNGLGFGHGEVVVLVCLLRLARQHLLVFALLESLLSGQHPFLIKIKTIVPNISNI